MAKKISFTKEPVSYALGAVLILIAALFLLSPYSHLRYLAYPIHYIVGTVGLYGFCFCLIEGGLHQLLHRVWPKSKVRAKFGFLITLIGLMLLLVAIIGGGNLYNAEQLPAGINEAYSGEGSLLYHNPALSGGLFLGGLIVLLRGATPALAYIVVSLVLLLGLVIWTFPYLKKGVRVLSANASLAKAKKQKEKEEKEEDFFIESEEPVNKAPTIPSLERVSPSLSFNPSPKENVDELDTNEVLSYSFAPAGGSTLPKRKQLRLQSATSNPNSVQGNPVPPKGSLGVEEIASPAYDTYAHNPVRTAGLKEAFFNPFGENETVAKPAAPSAPSFPFEGLRPSTLSNDPEPEPAPEPLPLMEESKKEEAPSTVLSLTIASPATESVETDPSEEEEESIYDEPENEPIVLAPNPSLVIAPEPTPEPEPSPAPVADPEPIATKKEEEKVEEDVEAPLPPYTFPDESMLDESKSSQDLDAIKEECGKKAELINQILADFHIGAHVVDILVGPSITRYSIEADAGVSVSSITRIVPDLEVRLGGVPCRFVERVLGQASSALEVVNATRRIVSFKELFVALPERKETADLRIPFGVAIDGSLKQADLAKFPHMLVAGTSGSGKSIFAHGILMSLVMRNRPENLKLVLIDPKRGVEMAPYKDMPHLLCPIIKEAKPARNALKILCDVMDERYERFADVGVRDISGYNAEYALPGHHKRMPYIVVLVDEFSDLVGECKEISDYVLRIAQKARACGIHLIVATQRPDVKVITGTIKSNLLCRVALTVASSQDSVTILGQGGAEDLYGYGDMLIDCQEISKRDFVRAQGCLGTAHEMNTVCNFIRKQLPPDYDPRFLHLEDDDEESSGPEIRDGGYAPVPQISSQELRKIGDEEKYNYIKSVIMQREYCSISMIQREFEVGFPRAGKIMARLQNEGIVAAPGDSANNSKGCRVLIHSADEETPAS